MHESINLILEDSVRCIWERLACLCCDFSCFVHISPNQLQRSQITGLEIFALKDLATIGGAAVQRRAVREQVLGCGSTTNLHAVLRSEQRHVRRGESVWAERILGECISTVGCFGHGCGTVGEEGKIMDIVGGRRTWRSSHTIHAHNVLARGNLANGFFEAQVVDVLQPCLILRNMHALISTTHHGVKGTLLLHGGLGTTHIRGRDVHAKGLGVNLGCDGTFANAGHVQVAHGKD